MAGPWAKFYWSDYRGDPALKLCSLAAQGLWMQMLCIAADADPIGYLVVNSRPLGATDLARLTGASEAEVTGLLNELALNGVFSRDAKARIYNRRMVRDARVSALAKKGGKLGGNPNIERGSVPKGERQTWNRSNNPTKVRQVWENCGGHCTHCSVAMTQDNPNLPTAFEIDHIIPLKDGGTNEIDNLVGSCKQCNFLRVANQSANSGAKHKKLEARSQIPERKKTHAGSRDPEFAEWYSAYPLKKAPEAAEKAYHRARRRGATHEQLLAGAKRYAGEMKDTEPRFIAHPATWLNAGRWQDESGTPTVTQMDPEARQKARLDSIASCVVKGFTNNLSATDADLAQLVREGRITEDQARMAGWSGPRRVA